MKRNTSKQPHRCPSAVRTKAKTWFQKTFEQRMKDPEFADAYRDAKTEIDLEAGVGRLTSQPESAPAAGLMDAVEPLEKRENKRLGNRENIRTIRNLALAYRLSKGDAQPDSLFRDRQDEVGPQRRPRPRGPNRRAKRNSGD